MRNTIILQMKNNKEIITSGEVSKEEFDKTVENLSKMKLEKDYSIILNLKCDMNGWTLVVGI